jgi:hypothetical protein
MSIPIGIQNLTSNELYIKELQVEVPANQTRFLGEYDFFVLAQAQSLKDAITADEAFVVRDGEILSKADSLAYVTSPYTGGGENNTASNVGGGAGVFKIKTGVDLELRSLVAGTNISINQSSDEITFNVTSTGIPLVSDDVDRDATYPSPSNDFQVYNKRQGLIETYNTTYGLWISSGMNVCVEDTTVQTVATQKAVFVTATATTIGGVEFPILGYVASSANRNVTQGVVTKKGIATGNPNETYVAVHHFGIYYVNYSAAITIGYNVYPNTAAGGDVIGAAFAQSGTLGQAIENSGSNPSFPGSVLVSLQNRR